MLVVDFCCANQELRFQDDREKKLRRIKRPVRFRFVEVYAAFGWNLLFA